MALCTETEKVKKQVRVVTWMPIEAKITVKYAFCKFQP